MGICMSSTRKRVCMRACSYKYIRYIFWKLFYNSTIGHLREGTGIFFKILKTFYDLLNSLKFILCFSNAIFGLHLSNTLSTIQSFQFRRFKHGRQTNVCPIETFVQNRVSVDALRRSIHFFSLRMSTSTQGTVTIIITIARTWDFKNFH